MTWDSESCDNRKPAVFVVTKPSEPGQGPLRQTVLTHASRTWAELAWEPSCDTAPVPGICHHNADHQPRYTQTGTPARSGQMGRQYYQWCHERRHYEATRYWSVVTPRKGGPDTARECGQCLTWDWPSLANVNVTPLRHWVCCVCPLSDGDHSWRASASCPHDILINSSPLPTKTYYDGPGRCNNVLMRCQHGVNYVVCKQ